MRVFLVVLVWCSALMHADEEVERPPLLVREDPKWVVEVVESVIGETAYEMNTYKTKVEELSEEWGSLGVYFKVEDVQLVSVTGGETPNSDIVDSVNAAVAQALQKEGLYAESQQNGITEVTTAVELTEAVLSNVSEDTVKVLHEGIERVVMVDGMLMEDRQSQSWSILSRLPKFPSLDDIINRGKEIAKKTIKHVAEGITATAEGVIAGVKAVGKMVADAVTVVVKLGKMVFNYTATVVRDSLEIIKKFVKVALYGVGVKVIEHLMSLKEQYNDRALEEGGFTILNLPEIVQMAERGQWIIVAKKNAVINFMDNFYTGATELIHSINARANDLVEATNLLTSKILPSYVGAGMLCFVNFKSCLLSAGTQLVTHYAWNVVGPSIMQFVSSWVDRRLEGSSGLSILKDVMGGPFVKTMIGSVFQLAISMGIDKFFPNERTESAKIEKTKELFQGNTLQAIVTGGIMNIEVATTVLTPQLAPKGAAGLGGVRWFRWFAHATEWVWNNLYSVFKEVLRNTIVSLLVAWLQWFLKWLAFILLKIILRYIRTQLNCRWLADLTTWTTERPMLPWPRRAYEPEEERRERRRRYKKYDDSFGDITLRYCLYFKNVSKQLEHWVDPEDPELNASFVSHTNDMLYAVFQPADENIVKFVVDQEEEEEEEDSYITTEPLPSLAPQRYSV